MFCILGVIEEGISLVLGLQCWLLAVDSCSHLKKHRVDEATNQNWSKYNR